MAKAVEVREGIPETFTVLPVRSLAVNTDFLPASLGAALLLRALRPSWDATCP